MIPGPRSPDLGQTRNAHNLGNDRGASSYLHAIFSSAGANSRDGFATIAGPGELAALLHPANRTVRTFSIMLVSAEFMPAFAPHLTGMCFLPGPNTPTPLHNDLLLPTVADVAGPRPRVQTRPRPSPSYYRHPRLKRLAIRVIQALQLRLSYPVNRLPRFKDRCPTQATCSTPDPNGIVLCPKSSSYISAPSREFPS